MAVQSGSVRTSVRFQFIGVTARDDCTHCLYLVMVVKKWMDASKTREKKKIYL